VRQEARVLVAPDGEQARLELRVLEVVRVEQVLRREAKNVNVVAPRELKMTMSRRTLPMPHCLR